MSSFTPFRHFAAQLLATSLVIFGLPASGFAESLASIKMEAGLTARLDAGDGNRFDNFGFSVAVSGATAVIGAPGNDADGRRNDADGRRDGAAYVFDRDPDDGTWVQVAKLTPAMKTKPFYFGRQSRRGDNFGFAVAVAGDVVVVGAPNENVGAALDAGAAYVFERHAGARDGWGQVARLSAAAAAEDRRFGLAVALAGDTVVVGAPGDAGGLRFVGSAYVFERDTEGAWTAAAELEPADGMTGDCFGFSVAIHGSTVLAGAPFSDQAGFYSGSAYVFERDGGGAWSRTARLAAADTAIGDRFGQAVAIEDGRAVVGAPKHDVPGPIGRNAGTAYVFEREASGTWDEAAKLVASDLFPNDRFGEAVALAGGTVIAGATGNDVHGVTGGFGSGSIYVMTPDGEGAWTEQEQLYDVDAGPFDVLGSALATAGGILLAGTPDNDDRGPSSGSVMVFELSGKAERKQ